MKLETFTKTNGAAFSPFGIEGYQLDWEAQIVTQKEIGHVITDTNNPKKWRDFMVSEPSDHIWMNKFDAGTTLLFKGGSDLQKKEGGWETMGIRRMEEQ